LNIPEKIRIGGIKFSEELIQVTVRCEVTKIQSVETLLTDIAQESITLPFYTSSVTNGFLAANFCANKSDSNGLQKLLMKSSFSEKDVTITSSVGMCTLFPHRNSLLLLGRIIQLMADYDFPLYSFSTSISALAVNTDVLRLDQLADKLQTLVELPENHAPFRQEFRVTQLDQPEAGA
jgi:aspartokinase